MIPWMLARLEQNPHATFTERELERDGGEFQRLRQEKLIKRLPIPNQIGSYVSPSGHALTALIDEAGRMEAFDEDDPETEFVELQLKDLAEWQVDLELLARHFQDANELEGNPSRLDDRFLLLGTLPADGSTGVVLGLFSEPRSAMVHLHALRTQLPPAVGRVAVACPSFVPEPSERLELLALGISVVTISEADPFVLDLAHAFPKPAPRLMRANLSTPEVQEFERHRFRSDLAIRLTGQTPGYRRNVVEVGGYPALVGDVAFRLFVRLVIELFKTDDGFLPLQEMRHARGVDSEGELAPDGIGQAIDRLRSPFKGHLGELEPKEFIERGSKRIRLSTHRACLSWDKEALLKHEDHVNPGLG